VLASDPDLLAAVEDPARRPERAEELLATELTLEAGAGRAPVTMYSGAERVEADA